MLFVLSSTCSAVYIRIQSNLTPTFVLVIYRTGYLKHAKKYKDAVQSSASILRGQTGADGVDMEGKVVVVTG